MRRILALSTPTREGLVDITSDVEKTVSASGIKNGLCSVYVQGATAGIMIQENWDQSVQTDVTDLLAKLIPQGVV